MPNSRSKHTANNLDAVANGLRRIGYKDHLLCQRYKFHDWFLSNRPIRVVDIAAFGQTPVSYDNACFAVVEANGLCGPELISQVRSLGAPRAFEVGKDRIYHWKVSASPSERDIQETLEPREIAKAFETHCDEWSPKSILRAKNIATPGPRQLDFVDLGLIPALEQHIREKLDPVLREIINGARNLYRNRHHSEPDWNDLIRLVFRSLAGKIMFDRRQRGFRSIQGIPDPNDLLAKVERHYQDPKPVLSDQQVRTEVVSDLWRTVSFENLSVEVLAYVWENTLVSDEVRRRLGIHATPPNIARYMVHRLPFENVLQDEQEERCVVEPCCGSGTFLIAALQRLRELLPQNVDPASRHKYFAQRLVGFDVETFGLEVARSSLMLADFPNPDGWRLEEEDVFHSPQNSRFLEAISQAKVVLCNPPFGDFNERERQIYSPRSVHKPAHLLLQISESLPQDAVLGFVLPRVFLDGRGYRGVRREIAKRFREIENVTLPDKVFEHAQHETVLLIAHAPRRTDNLISLFHRKVGDAERTAFLAEYKITREDRSERTSSEASETMAVPDLQEIWKHLAGRPKLGEAVKGIHRGIEWNLPLTQRDAKTGKKKPILENIQKLVSPKPKKGFRRGLKDTKTFSCFQAPAPLYLNTMPEFQRGNAHKLDWGRAKVIFNSKRKSRGRWRLVAIADTSGLAAYQTFTCAWPLPPWKPETIAAILNGPIANAFITAHEGNRDITKETLVRIPMPEAASLDQHRLEKLITEYVALVQKSSSPSTCDNHNVQRMILREIDAIILQAYRIPPRHEHQLLEYFRGYARPVPFDFGDYYPEDFKSYIPLWMYDSQDFANATAQKFMEELPEVTDPDLQEILASL